MFCKNCAGRTPINNAAGSECIEECGTQTARRGFQLCTSCSDATGKCEACGRRSVKENRKRPRALERRADYMSSNGRRSRAL